jgi:hypothetical protein
MEVSRPSKPKSVASSLHDGRASPKPISVSVATVNAGHRDLLEPMGDAALSQEHLMRGETSKSRGVLLSLICAIHQKFLQCPG